GPARGEARKARGEEGCAGESACQGAGEAAGRQEEVAAASMASKTVPGPLAGLKVLEMGQLIAGPFAAKTLADFGADVVKIEPPGSGDPLRKWRLLKDGTSVWWQVQSRNK